MHYMYDYTSPQSSDDHNVVGSTFIWIIDDIFFIFHLKLKIIFINTGITCFTQLNYEKKENKKCEFLYRGRDNSKW